MSITTKTGDDGTTGLYWGARVAKDSGRIEAIGAVDELNSAIGLVHAQAPERFRNLLTHIQNTLFVVGAELADHESKSSQRITQALIDEIEKEIFGREKKLPPLREFILPGGTPFVAHAHLARAICRRAERRCVTLLKQDGLSKLIVIYLNRLSDLLFILAREGLEEAKISEIRWNKA